MLQYINRRHFLRGAGVLLALPALESLAYDTKSFSRNKKPATPSKRMIFLGFGWGVTNETWYPDVKDTGANYKLPQGLAPLAKYKKDFTLIQGCSHQFSNEAHWGSTFWLTGANRYAVAGQSFSNTISADQVSAAAFGQESRFSSMQLCSRDSMADGHGMGLSLAWDERGKPMAGIDSPIKLYHKLFSADDMPLEQRQAALKEKRSVMDTIFNDAKRLQRGLSKTDGEKLDEYFQGIRDIENRISKDEQWLTVPKEKAPLAPPPKGLKGKNEIKAMYDLIVAALQTDTTRVMTYRQPVKSLLQSIGVKVAPHDMSHYTPGDRMQASQKRDHAQSELLAGLIAKLKAAKEADGSSLYDHVSLAYGSNIRSIHNLNNCPTIIAGGGSNLKMGQHLVLPDDTPLCNVWLSMLKGSGVKVDRHGDSTGIIKELQV